jgi:sulfide:quinone oxidoreductase
MQHVSGPAHEPMRVLVAGGGVGGLETLVALRGLAAERVALTLVAPEETFSLRALTVLEPFDGGHPQTFALAELADELGATFHRDSVGRVQPDTMTVRLRSGTELAYDVLVLAVGACPVPAYHHGVSFDRAHEAEAFDELLGDALQGLAPAVAVVIPPGCSWTLPGYELALMIAAWGKAGTRTPVAVTLVTPEVEPLEVFGPPASDLALAELAAAGVRLITGARAEVPAHTIVDVRPGERIAVDRVVHLPLLVGPRLRGVPCDTHGFTLVGEHGTVGGELGVYAIGDGTAHALKQGGLAAQQADCVARHIAHMAGAPVASEAYRPVLKALLSTARGPRYLRAAPPGGHGECVVSTRALWWPPSKVASRWLMPFLAARDRGPVPA